jgi:hypothetical protein
MFKNIAISVDTQVYSYDSILRLLNSYPAARLHKEPRNGWLEASDSIIIDRLVFTDRETLRKNGHEFDHNVVFLPIYNDMIDDVNYARLQETWLDNKVRSISESMSKAEATVIVLMKDRRIPPNINVENVFRQLKDRLGKSIWHENILLLQDGSLYKLINQLNFISHLTMSKSSALLYTDEVL